MKIKKLVKLYSVEFIEYTNATYDTVTNKDGQYLDVKVENGGDFIIREDEIDFYKPFGKGFRSLNYVGRMYADCWLDEED